MATKATPLAFPITNSYMFSHIFSEERNARPLLEAVLGVPIGEIRYVDDEHEVEPSPRGRGVRMDVFVEDGTGTVYDVEMQNAADDDLRLRSRYLLSSFDRERIARGERYGSLGKTVVIFVCAFDPIGDGERIYMVRPTVVGSGRHFDDGTLRVLLNAKGAAKEPMGKGRLSAFLSYVDGGGTMGDEWIEGIDDEVRELNGDRSWRNTMLTWQSIFDEELERATKKLAEERAEQLAKGMAEDLAKDMAEERAEQLAKDMAEDLAKDMAEDLAKDMAEDMAEQLAKGMAEDMAEDLAKDMADKLVEQNRRLAQALADAGRASELMDAMLDVDVRTRLLEEFGIETGTVR